MNQDIFVDITTQRAKTGSTGVRVDANQAPDAYLTSIEIAKHFQCFEIQVIGKDEQGNCTAGYESIKEAKQAGEFSISVAVYGRDKNADGQFNPWYLLHEVATEDEAFCYELELRNYLEVSHAAD